MKIKGADILGSLNLVFIFLEQSVIPMLTFNCESLTCLKKKTLKILNELFHNFCRVVLRVGVEWRISFFTGKAALLQKNKLPRQVYDIQEEEGRGSCLYSELKPHL